MIVSCFWGTKWYIIQLWLWTKCYLWLLTFNMLFHIMSSICAVHNIKSTYTWLLLTPNAKEKLTSLWCQATLAVWVQPITLQREPVSQNGWDDEATKQAHSPREANKYVVPGKFSCLGLPPHPTKGETVSWKVWMRMPPSQASRLLDAQWGKGKLMTLALLIPVICK